MARRFIAAVALATMAICSAFSSMALAQQPQCGPREAFLRAGWELYQEAPAYAGVLANGRFLEVWATEDGATFTVLITHMDEAGNAVSCIATAGENWRPVGHAAPGQDS